MPPKLSLAHKRGHFSSSNITATVRVLAKELTDKNCLEAIFGQKRHQDVSSGPQGGGEFFNDFGPEGPPTHCNPQNPKDRKGNDGWKDWSSGHRAPPGSICLLAGPNLVLQITNRKSLVIWNRGAQIARISPKSYDPSGVVQSPKSPESRKYEKITKNIQNPPPQVAPRKYEKIRINTKNGSFLGHFCFFFGNFFVFSGGKGGHLQAKKGEIMHLTQQRLKETFPSFYKETQKWPGSDILSPQKSLWVTLGSKCSFFWAAANGGVTNGG